MDLLKELKNIENNLGREKSERWGPRSIDLDLLFYDNIQLTDPEADLTIPHPRIAERDFVLGPLIE